MTVRRLGPDDAAHYRAIMLQAYAQHPDAFTSSVREREALPPSWWAERLAAGDGTADRVFGAFGPEGALCGVAGLSLDSRDKARHKATLFGMYVLPAHRAAGWGRRLVQATLDHARAQPGVLQALLTVTEGNGAAQRLYESFGFHAWGVEPQAVAVNEGFVNKVHMICHLHRPAGPTATPD